MEVTFRTPLPVYFADKLKEVYSILRAHTDELQMVELWLFGSVARGDFNAFSDLDFLLVSTGEHHDISLKVEYLDVRDDLPDAQGRPPVDVVVIKPESLKDTDFPFVRFVLEDRLLLWRKDGWCGV